MDIGLLLPNIETTNPVPHPPAAVRVRVPGPWVCSAVRLSCMDPTNRQPVWPVRASRARGGAYFGLV